VPSISDLLEYDRADQAESMESDRTDAIDSPQGNRTALMDEVEAEDAAARPYRAVVTEVPGVDVYRVESAEAVPAAPRRGARGENFVTDLPIALVSLALAGVAFLPWYKGPKDFGLSSSGWASGTWGPLIFFLAVGSVVLVVLRRVGVGVSLPVEESLFHEGAGWISLVGAVIKSRARPGPEGLLTTSYGAWIAIGLAAVLIILAGRMSPHAPLVVRPGWHKARAGIIGIVILSVVVAGSAVFGATNKASTSTESGFLAGTVQGRLPDCADKFPLPPGVKPDFGFGTGTVCQAQLSSTKNSAVLTKEFRALLTKQKYTFTELTGAPGSTVFTITKPRCTTLAVVPSETGSLVAISFTSCQVPPSPGRR
jgi:hypothetical protein